MTGQAIRQALQDHIASQYGPLRTSRDELVGEWIHSFFSDDGTPSILHPDGTISCKFDKESKPKGKWEYVDNRFTDHTWSEPAPDYGLDEGT